MAIESNPPPDGKPDTASDGGRLDLSEVKRKRGRPPGSKTKPVGQSAKPLPAGPGAPNLDAEFLGKTAVCLLEIVDEVSARVLKNRIRKVAPDQALAFQELYEEVGLNDKDRAMVGMSVEAIARKYALLAKFGPEVLLFAALGQYGLRQAKLHQFVADIAKQRSHEKDTARPHPAPAPAPAPGPGLAPSAN